MPAKPPSSRGAAARNRAELIDDVVAALRDMDELKAEPVIGEPGLVAVVGFVEVSKLVDRLLAPKEIKP